MRQSGNRDMTASKIYVFGSSCWGYTDYRVYVRDAENGVAYGSMWVCEYGHEKDRFVMVWSMN